MSGMNELRQRIAELSTSVWAYATLAAAVEAGLLDLLTEPRGLADLSARTGLDEAVVEGLLDVLVALGMVRREGDIVAGAPALLPLLQAPAKDDFLADLRSTYLQSWHLIQSAKQGRLVPGWQHTDPDILQAQGRSGRALTQMLAQYAFPLLGDLEQRLQAPTARFLDAGTGVGVIAIELCRHYPHLHVVGLEPQAAPLAEARRNVAAAQLEQRIELRAQRIEDLTDHESFDLAYLPQVFMPVDVVRRGLRTIFQALRPGGWVTLPVISAPGQELDAALFRLRNTLWGGEVLFAEQVAELVREAGFTVIQSGGAPGSMVQGVVGQRPA
jgi:2-polyprenyl-3-methyl-5-hydroxy-6-metoxy-1,4-benzoquinol methylase